MGNDAKSFLKKTSFPVEHQDEQLENPVREPSWGSSCKAAVVCLQPQKMLVDTTSRVVEPGLRRRRSKHPRRCHFWLGRRGAPTQGAGSFPASCLPDISGLSKREQTHREEAAVNREEV